MISISGSEEIDQGRIGIGIGTVEFSHDCAHRFVLGKDERSGGVQVGGCLIRIA